MSKRNDGDGVAKHNVSCMSATLSDDSQEIDFDDPRIKAIIYDISRERPWRRWIDLWFYRFVRRWPVAIWTFLFFYAHGLEWGAWLVTPAAIFLTGIVSLDFRKISDLAAKLMSPTS